MLPITSAVQKELLPVLNRPVADYIVADLVAAGIKRIIFVIRPGQSGLKDYYQGNSDFEATLRRLGKTAELDMLQTIHAQATFEFVEQASEAGYGTAVALQTAFPLLDPEEPVIVCGGDDFVWRGDGSSEMRDFVEAYVSAGADSAIMALDIPDAKLHDYGVLATKTENGHNYLTDIVEKPLPGTAPSSLANISKYILSGSIRDIARQSNGPQPQAENFITDAIVIGSKRHSVVVYRAKGTYLDTGNTTNWLHANRVVAGEIEAK